MTNHIYPLGNTSIPPHQSTCGNESNSKSDQIVSIQVEMERNSLKAKKSDLNDAKEVNGSTEETTIQQDDKNHQKHKKKPHVKSAFREILTTISHICIFSYTILIVYLCLIHEFKFFTWHPLLLSLGWAFGMTESILTLSRDNLIFGAHSHQFQKKVHWIILIPSGICILIGFTIAIIAKNNHDPPKEHFTTWHAIFGLIGVVCTVPPYVNGVLLWFRKELSDYIDGKIVKLVHIVSGMVSFSFGSVSLFLSLYTKWFGRNTGNMDRVFYFGVVTMVFPVIWALYKPLMMCYRTIKSRV